MAVSSRNETSKDTVALTLAAGAILCTCLLWLLVTPGMTRALWISGVAVIGAIGASLAQSRGPAIMSPLALAALSLGIIFWLRPYIDHSLGDTTYQLGLTIAGRYQNAVELGALGVLAFTVAIAIPYKGRPSQGRDQGASTKIPLEPSMPLVRNLTYATIAISSGAILLFLAQGGTRVLFAGREQAAIDFLQASNGYLYTAPLWIFPVGLYIYARGLKERLRSLKWWGIAIMVASQFVSFGLGDRSYFLVALLAAFWVRFVVLGRQPRLLIVAALLPIVLFVGVVVPREARMSESLSAAIGSSLEDSTSWYSPFLGDDFAMARNLALVLHVVPEHTGFALGSTYVAALARPIPSSLFGGDKPLDADARLNEAAVYRFEDFRAGFSYSAFSEPYFNFGIIGVGAFGLVAGRLLRRFDHWAFSLERSLVEICVAGSIFGLILVMVRGNVGTNVQRIAFYTGALLILAWLARRERTKTEAVS